MTTQPIAPPNTGYCRNKYRWLVPSNPDADDEVFIYAALLNPHLFVLADFTREFGLPRMRAAWKRVADTPRGIQVRTSVERMLKNFEIGLGHIQRSD